MQYKYTVLTNTTMGAFMSQLDGNIVLIALPTITRSLNASAFEALWVLMGYILMTAVLLLAFGRLADMYGKVRLYNLGFAIFTIGSGLCSLSINGGMLVFFRLVQGVGAALIWANNVAILTDAFPPNERGRAIGVNLVAGISGSVIGLILGGILSVALGWQSIFWINLPIGAFATFWAYKKLRELGTVHHERIDLPGNVLFAGGLTAFLVGLTLGALSGYTLVDVASMGAGLLMLGAFAYVELHTRTPLMDLTLFKVRAFTAGILSNFLASIARSGVSLVLTIFFQGALLYDAFRAGVALIPFAVAFVSLGPLSGYLSDKYGPRGFTTAGLSISTVGLVGLSFIPANASYSILALYMVLVGAGGGMFVAPNMSSIMSSAPVTRRGVASGMSATLVTTGALLSLSISFAVLATSIPLNVLQAVFAGIPLPSGAPSVDLFIGPMHTIFQIMAVMSLIAIVPSALRGQQVGVVKPKLEVREQVA
ncbi:MAG TPA: MFS transporter [Candidatus Bathyarchaeia archaeon]|nr:MFS transporter [Candidatus Bathyarchaeia archaeon]